MEELGHLETFSIRYLSEDGVSSAGIARLRLILSGICFSMNASKLQVAVHDAKIAELNETVGKHEGKSGHLMRVRGLLENSD